MKYTVGQVLYVILSRKSQVYPMLVVEEITKRTLHGEQINYVLQGGSNPSDTVLLDQIEGEIFESAEDAKNTLVSRATSQIEKIVSVAIEKSKQWYSKSLSQETVIHELPTEDSTTIQLPDGTTARLTVSA